MRYLALRRRADLLLAGLGADRSRTLIITGGLEGAITIPQAPEPMEPAPEPRNNPCRV